MSPFDPAGLKVRLEEIDKKVNENGFWDDPEAAQKVMKEKKSIEDKLSELDALEGQMEDLENRTKLLLMRLKRLSEGYRLRWRICG